MRGPRRWPLVVFLFTALAISVIAVVANSDWSAPELKLDSPGEDARTLARRAEVRGTVQDSNEITVTVNGKTVQLKRVEEHWAFHTTIDLERGKNPVVVVARDEAGNVSRAVRTVECFPTRVLDLRPQAGAITSETSTWVSARLEPPMPGVAGLNGKTAPLDARGRFRIRAALDEGENKILLEIRPDGEDPIKRVLEITRDTTPPRLELDWPPAKRPTLRDRVWIRGRVKDRNLTQVTLGDEVLTDKPGTFRHEVDLPERGDHTIVLVARDSAGLTTELRRTIRRVDRLVATPRPLNAGWADVERRLRKSLVLIGSRMLGRTKDKRTITISAFGAGVFVSRSGHILTAKHIVEPWKFRPLATRLAREGISIIDGSWHLHAWPVGRPFRSADGSLDLDGAWSSSRGTLELLRTAADKWGKADLTGDHGSRLAIVHEASEAEDLAILKASTKPVPARLLQKPQRVLPGDEVLVLGFPTHSKFQKTGLTRSTWALGRVREATNRITLRAEDLGGHLDGPYIDRDGRVVGFSTRLIQGRMLLDAGPHIENAHQLLFRKHF